MKNIKINFIKILFYLAYILAIFNYMSSAVIGLETFRKIVIVLICILLLFIIIVQSKKYKKNTLMFIVLSLVTGLICYYVSGDSGIFLTILFVIAAKNVSFDEVVKFDFWLKLILIFVIIILYKNGMTDVIRRYRSDGTIRYAMGFGHPNVFGAYLFFICMDLFYLKYKKYKLHDYIFLIVAFLISYFVCDSRSAQVGIMLLFIFSIIFKKFENNKILESFNKFLPIGLFLFSYIITIMYKYGASIAYFIDNIFNKRIQYSAEYLNYFGYSLFGNNYTIFTNYVLDNSYFNIFMQYGIIMCSLFLIAMVLIISKAYKEKKYNVIMCIVVFLIYGLMERYIYMIGYNAILLFLSSLIYYKNTDKVLENNNIIKGEE